MSRVMALVGVLALAASLAPGCSLGDGVGTVSGELNVPVCWEGNFDLKPDFFAAIPYLSSVTLRLQAGSDYEAFSDGVSILVDDIGLIRGTEGAPALLGQHLEVALPPGVTPPGIPVMIVPDPANVHFTLYLQKTCRTQNIALYAVDAVTLNSLGQCADEPTAGAATTEAVACSALGLAPSDGGTSAPSDAGTDAGADASTTPPPLMSSSNIATSWIQFDALFDGDPSESDAQKRLNQGEFDVYLADPREVCPGGIGPPPRCRAHLKGNFDFYFERGRPAQPFP